MMTLFLETTNRGVNVVDAAGEPERVREVKAFAAQQFEMNKFDRPAARIGDNIQRSRA
jgi:hypothetical protein